MDISMQLLSVSNVQRVSLEKDETEIENGIRIVVLYQHLDGTIRTLGQVYGKDVMQIPSMPEHIERIIFARSGRK